MASKNIEALLSAQDQQAITKLKSEIANAEALVVVLKAKLDCAKEARTQ
jgi:hypothetical protein